MRIIRHKISKQSVYGSRASSPVKGDLSFRTGPESSCHKAEVLSSFQNCKCKLGVQLAGGGLSWHALNPGWVQSLTTRKRGVVMAGF